MNPPPFRRSRLLPPDPSWSVTVPSGLGSAPPRQAPRGLARGTGQRPGHTTPGPFDELLDGLDVQELDSQTLFDRFFGPAPGPSPDR